MSGCCVDRKSQGGKMSEPTNTNYIKNLQLTEEDLYEIHQENARLKEQNKIQNELIDMLREMYAKESK
jgi:hypothetical protein